MRSIKTCKHCNRGLPVYKNTARCIECHREDNRNRWHKYKDYYNKTRRKPKVEKTCKYCGSIFETAKANQKFCSESCQHKWHYENNKLYHISRGMAINRIYDKGKKKIGGYIYTDKEINYIKKNMFKKTAIEIAKKLDRPIQGVRWKIRQLKILQKEELEDDSF